MAIVGIARFTGPVLNFDLCCTERKTRRWIARNGLSSVRRRGEIYPLSHATSGIWTSLVPTF